MSLEKTGSDSPGDLSLREGREVAEGPGRGKMWSVGVVMVSEGQ